MSKLRSGIFPKLENIKLSTKSTRLIKRYFKTNMKKIAFLPDVINLRYPGYQKILEPILKRSQNYRITYEGESLDDSWEVVPFGVIKCASYFDKGLNVAYLVDSVSLGYGSVFLFYLRRGKIFHPELWLNLLRYIKYAPLEKRIVTSYKKIIVASKHDAEYLNRRYGRCNVFAIANGVDTEIDLTAVRRKNKARNFEYKIGMLNYWGAGKPHDFTWFVDEILPQLRNRFPDIRIILAGRGGTPELIKYFKKNNCEFVGEVESLADFFATIDIFVTSMRKECGILNKALDAFSNNKIVAGFAPNMKAFSDLDNGFLTYSNAKEMIECIEFVRDHPREIAEMEINAYQYVLSNNNWDNKMNELEHIFE